MLPYYSREKMDPEAPESRRSTMFSDDDRHMWPRRCDLCSGGQLAVAGFIMGAFGLALTMHVLNS